MRFLPLKPSVEGDVPADFLTDISTVSPQAIRIRFRVLAWHLACLWAMGVLLCGVVLVIWLMQSFDPVLAWSLAVLGAGLGVWKMILMQRQLKQIEHGSMLLMPISHFDSNGQSGIRLLWQDAPCVQRNQVGDPNDEPYWILLQGSSQSPQIVLNRLGILIDAWFCSSRTEEKKRLRFSIARGMCTEIEFIRLSLCLTRFLKKASAEY